MEKLRAKQIGILHRRSIPMQRIVVVDGVGKFDPDAVDVEIVEQRRRAAGKHLAHVLLPETRSESA